MSSSIINNISAINTHRNVGVANSKLSSSLEKLSSGYRINTGKDAPADLVISEQLRSQCVGLQRAIRNTNEANNVIAIAEGAMNEMNAMLKSMRSLALHAANSGVTTGSQMAADQAELDSAIQTIEMIANTTKFSSESLLNGNKDLAYVRKTLVTDTQQNSLLDVAFTRINQVYKTDNYKVSVGYSGTKKDAAGDEIADLSKQAQRAYLEIDSATGNLSGIAELKLGSAQQFTLTGNLGSRQFTYKEGDSITQVVSDIQSSASTTGINASLVFNSVQAVTLATAVADTNVAEGDAVGGADELTVYNNNGGKIISALEEDLVGAVVGKNTDGQGNIYVKVTQSGATATYELYKDASLSAESLVATGSTGGAIVEVNGSGLSDLKITIDDTDAKVGDVACISTAGMALDDAAGTTTMKATFGNDLQLDVSTVAGVALGKNTDDSGMIYFKATVLEGGTEVQLSAYKDIEMTEDSLVATTTGSMDSVSYILDEVNGSGLGLHLSFADASKTADGIFGVADATAGTTAKGTLQFENIGARVYTEDYGSNAKLSITQNTGDLFTYYQNQDDASTKKLITASGNAKVFYGQDAQIIVNGQNMYTNGLGLNVATTDLQASFSFNEGKAGSTTLAQVGYGDGSVFTRIGALTLTSLTATDGFSSYNCNAGHNTKEQLTDFSGGMRLQLGEGASDHNRTTLAIQAMTTDKIGRIYHGTNSNGDKNILSLQDLLGGKSVSLAENAVLALSIIDQAINDVSESRARLGAFQSNMLTTNANNLAVAVENIQKTEAGIRDTDMASEMTSFTAAQILTQTSMAMLAQANASAQSVLQLM